MLPVNNERFKLELYKRKANSKYEWEEEPSCCFKGRPANQIELKSYRIQKGVNGNTDSTFVYSTNLPSEVKPGDRVSFLGKFWTVNSIGYYYESSRIINPSILSEEQIIERCPKGLNLQ